MPHYRLTVRSLPPANTPSSASSPWDKRLVTHTVDAELDTENQTVTVNVVGSDRKKIVDNKIWGTTAYHGNTNKDRQIFAVFSVFSVLFRERILDTRSSYGIEIADCHYSYIAADSSIPQVVIQSCNNSKTTKNFDDTIISLIQKGGQEHLDLIDPCQPITRKIIAGSAAIFCFSAISLTGIQLAIAKSAVSLAAIGGATALGVPYLSIALICVCAVSLLVGIVAYKFFLKSPAPASLSNSTELNNSV